MYFCTVNVHCRVVICALRSANWQQASKVSALWTFELIWKDGDKCAYQYNNYKYHYHYVDHMSITLLISGSGSIGLAVLHTCKRWSFVTESGNCSLVLVGRTVLQEMVHRHKDCACRPFCCLWSW